jgi:hypothetical protein
MLSQEEIDELKTYYEKEKAEKNSAFSVIVLALLRGIEKRHSNLSNRPQEEIDALRRFYKEEKRVFKSCP